MSELNSNHSVRGYLSMIRKAWSGRLELPIEWLGGPDSKILRFYYTFPAVAGLLQSLGEEQIKPIHVEEHILRMLDVNDPLPDFVEPQQMVVYRDVEDSPIFEMNTIMAFERFNKVLTFALGECTDVTWKWTVRFALHIMGFFTDFIGTINRESIVGKPLQDKHSENAPGIDFAVMINRYGSRPHSALLYNFTLGHMSPSLMDRSLNYANSMRITPTHPALLIGIVENNETFTPQTEKQFLTTLVPLVEPSLHYLINGWRQYCLQKGLSMEEPFPSWLIVFSLVVDWDQVTIVAHYPSSPHLRAFTDCPEFSCLVLDSIPSHISIRMSAGNIWEDLPPDTPWIYDRLRLAMALSRIMKNSRHILLMWDELRWSSNDFLEEEEYDRKAAAWKWRTPNPSETADDIWAESLGKEAREDYEIEKEAIRSVYFADEDKDSDSDDDDYNEGEDVVDVPIDAVDGKDREQEDGGQEGKREEDEEGEEETTGLVPIGSDNDDSKAQEDAVRKSIERVLLWSERLPEDAFDPLPVDRLDTE